MWLGVVIVGMLDVRSLILDEVIRELIILILI